MLLLGLIGIIPLEIISIHICKNYILLDSFASQLNKIFKCIFNLSVRVPHFNSLCVFAQFCF
jgi:hypothetical protein